jgi:hypothetical protein
MRARGERGITMSAPRVLFRALREHGYIVSDEPAESVSDPKNRVTYTAALPLRREVDYYQAMLDRIYVQALLSSDTTTRGHSVALETTSYLNGETRHYLTLFDPDHQVICEVLLWPNLCGPPPTQPGTRTEGLGRADKDRKKYWTPLV